MASNKKEKYAGLKIEDIINEIAEYENLAKTMLEEGKTEAENMIARAEKEGRELLELREKEAYAEAERILSDAEIKAKKKHKEIIKAAGGKIEELNSSYIDIQDEFVKELVKKILN